MKNSHLALLGALGVVALFIVVSLGWLRVTSTSFDDGNDRPPSVARRADGSYDLSGFTAIDVSGQWEVTVTRGDTWSVELSYPEGLEDNLDVGVNGEELFLRYRSSGWFGNDFGADGRVTARITMPELHSAELSGAMMLAFDGFAGEQLHVEASGASNVSGRNSRYDELDLDLSGAGNVDFREVTVKDADIDVSGATNVTLRMDGGELRGDISGAGNLTYYGTVSQERVNASGLTSVNRAGN